MQRRVTWRFEILIIAHSRFSLEKSREIYRLNIPDKKKKCLFILGFIFQLYICGKSLTNVSVQFQTFFMYSFFFSFYFNIKTTLYRRDWKSFTRKRSISSEYNKDVMPSGRVYISLVSLPRRDAPIYISLRKEIEFFTTSLSPSLGR